MAQGRGNATKILARNRRSERVALRLVDIAKRRWRIERDYHASNRKLATTMLLMSTQENLIISR